MDKANLLFFSGVQGILLPHIDAPGLMLRGGLRVTTDRAYTKRTIGSYLRDIGSVEANFLENMATAFAAARGQIPFSFENPAAAANGIVIQYLAHLQAWLFELWLEKDNAVNFDTGWIVL